MFRFIWTELINFLLKGTKIMATVEDINAKQDEVLALQAAHDAKLDEVKAFILQLLEGTATPAQLQAISDKMDQIKSGAGALLAETDALDEPTP